MKRLLLPLLLASSLAFIETGCGRPPLRLERAPDHVVLDMQTLGEYQTTVSRIRVRAGEQVVWEVVVQAGVPQVHSVTLSRGSNPPRHPPHTRRQSLRSFLLAAELDIVRRPMRNTPIAQWRSAFFFVGQVVVVGLQIFLLLPVVTLPAQAPFVFRLVDGLYLPLLITGLGGSFIFAIVAFVRCKGPIALAFLLASSTSLGLIAGALIYLVLFRRIPERELGVGTIFLVQLALSLVVVWLSFVVIWFQREPSGQGAA